MRGPDGEIPAVGAEPRGAEPRGAGARRVVTGAGPPGAGGAPAKGGAALSTRTAAPSTAGAAPSTAGAAPSMGSAARADAERVQAMFDRIAGVYDAMNAVMTAGLHARWRARAADLAGLRAGERALDVASGTGDLALELASRVGPGGEVVGCDFAEAMLARARAKAARARALDPRLAQVRFERADALALPYGDSSFDAATVGFGVRNFADVPRGLRELVRVVRPGGRVVILEITQPTRVPLRWFFGVWFERLVPLLGRFAGSAEAYAYLPSSVRRFLSPGALAAQMQAAGLAEVRYVLTAGSIIAIHAGTVP